MERLGTDYGGFEVPTGLIGPNWIVYSGGVGEDISFDLALIERFRCHVYAFDPTPRAIAHVKTIDGDARYHFMAIGLWHEAALLKFFAPADAEHVSHSIVNLQATEDYFEAKCQGVPALMDRLGHDRIDLLKLNIEGAEYEVLESVLAAGLGIRVLCVAFDQPTPIWRTHRMVRRLIDRGYRLCGMDAWKFTFLHDG